MALEGLKWIEIELALNKWNWNLDGQKTNVAKKKALEDLQRVVEDRHPGVQVHVVVKREY